LEHRGAENLQEVVARHTAGRRAWTSYINLRHHVHVLEIELARERIRRAQDLLRQVGRRPD
jgi:hypothetical protein